ncbi:MAG: peptidase M17 [Euryarchaeota archaeon]|nr:peptidase M17 [Euryarchaeota archaeon]
MTKAAEVAISTVLRARRGERVVIFTNPHGDGQAISRALFAAALGRGARPVIVTQPMKTTLDFAEDSVLMAIRSEPEVLISISQEKLGKDRWALKKPFKVGRKKYDSAFNYLLGVKRARSFWSPSVTADMFLRTVPVDYGVMKRDCAAVARVLTAAESVRITTAKGMDLHIGLEGRRARRDDGDFSKPGSGGNLPAGEVFISPALGTSNGRIVFDGSISTDKGAIVIREPIVADVEGGFVKRILGGEEARRFERAVGMGAARARQFVRDGKLPGASLAAYVRNSRNLGELGIGLNRAAKVVGNVLEDEKVFRTCHIAVGSNYDDDAPALTHYDGIIHSPTITARMKGGRGRPLLENGELRV